MLMQDIDSAPILGDGQNAPTVPGFGVVGAGFNIFGKYDYTSVKSKLFVDDLLDYDSVELGKKTYLVPKNIVLTPTREKGGTLNLFSSREEISRHFSTKANIDASAFAFTGHIDALYSKTVGSKIDYTYALRETTDAAYTLSLKSDASDKLEPEFARALKSLPTVFNDANRAMFFAFFKRYGTHFVHQVQMGGNMYFSTAVSKSFTTSETEIKLNITAEYEGMFASAKAESESHWKDVDKNWSQNRSVSIRATGGDNSLLDMLEPQAGKWVGDKLIKWNESLEDKPGIVNFHLRPISQLCALDQIEAAGQALKAFMNGGITAKACALPSAIKTGSVESYPAISSFNRTVPVKEAQPEPTHKDARTSGAQVVLFDEHTHAVLFNKTYYADALYSPDVLAMYKRMVDDARRFDDKNYYCAVAIFGVFSPLYPSRDMEAWLSDCGAKLTLWKNQIGLTTISAGFACYSLVGKRGSSTGVSEDFKLSNFTPSAGFKSESVARYFVYGEGLSGQAQHETQREAQQVQAGA